MKKSGQLFLASKEIINPITNKNLGEFKAFWYQRIDKNMYLIIFDRIFTRDPYERKYRIMTERNFKSLIKGHKLQEIIR